MNCGARVEAELPPGAPKPHFVWCTAPRCVARGEWVLYVLSKIPCPTPVST